MKWKKVDEEGKILKKKRERKDKDSFGGFVVVCRERSR